MENLAPWLALGLAFIFLLLLNRWISQHLQGIGLLITGNQKASLFLYFIILFPGILIHELSHWFMAKLLGIKTGKIRLGPVDEGRAGYYSMGSVEVARSDPLRDSLIGLAPLLAGCALLVVITHHVFNVPSLVQGTNWQALIKNFKHWLGKRDFWLWLYLVFTVSNAMMPSAKDREPWGPAILFISIVALAGYFTGWLSKIPPSIATITKNWAISLAWSMGFTCIVDLAWAFLIGLAERSIELITGRRVIY